MSNPKGITACTLVLTLFALPYTPGQEPAQPTPKAPQESAQQGPDQKSDAKPDEKWRPLFDGQTLAGWKPTNFGGEGDVYVEDGKLILDFGASMTGITYIGQFPPSPSYEIRVDAMRVDGHDFFCGLTFPVRDNYCSLIVGGWGGAVVGLSSIDGRDASENETTKFMKFDSERWYRFRLRVTPQRIQAWIDDQLTIDQNIEGRKVTTRSEVVLNKPLGFATWETRAALRNIEYRSLAE